MNRRPAPIRIKTSAGGVVYEKREDDIWVVLIKPVHGHVLTLPKGEMDAGETEEETAIREVREETGLRGKIIEKLDSVTYWYYLRRNNIKYKKTVHYFLMAYAGGSIEDHDHEVEEVLWMKLEDARKQVRYRSDMKMLDMIAERFREGEHGTGL